MPVTETAADLEAEHIQIWAHAGTLEEAMAWREFFRDRYADEQAIARAGIAAGEPGDVWGECRRLLAVIAAVDDDLRPRRMASRSW